MTTKSRPELKRTYDAALACLTDRERARMNGLQQLYIVTDFRSGIGSAVYDRASGEEVIDVSAFDLELVLGMTALRAPTITMRRFAPGEGKGRPVLELWTGEFSIAGPEADGRIGLYAAVRKTDLGVTDDSRSMIGAEGGNRAHAGSYAASGTIYEHDGQFNIVSTLPGEI